MSMCLCEGGIVHVAYWGAVFCGVACINFDECLYMCVLLLCRVRAYLHVMNACVHVFVRARMHANGII